MTTAPSAFINAKIRVGPLRFHRLITLVATTATLALVALGGIYGWDAAQETTLAFVQDGDGAAAVNQAANFDNQIVDVVTSVCGVTSTEHGLIVGPNIIIVPSNEVGQSGEVQVAAPNNNSGLETRPGTVIGVDGAVNMVVIRSDLGVSSEPFVWRTATGLVVGGSVYIVLPRSLLVTQDDPDGDDFAAVEATIDSLRYDNDGTPESIRLLSKSAPEFPPGSPVLDQTLRLIGVIDQTGDSMNTADVLQPSVSTIVVNPQPPVLVCEPGSD